MARTKMDQRINASPTAAQKGSPKRIKRQAGSKNTAGVKSSGAVKDTAVEMLYGQNFSSDEIESLQLLNASDLRAEISMLRVAMRRVFAAAGASFSNPETTGSQGESQSRQSQPSSSPGDSWMEVLDGLGMASSRLAGLLRTQRLLEKDRQGEIGEALSQALAEITKEMKLE